MDGVSTTTNPTIDPMTNEDDITPDASEPQPSDPNAAEQCSDDISPEQTDLPTEAVANKEAEPILDDEAVDCHCAGDGDLPTSEATAQDSAVQDATAEETNDEETTATDDSVEIHPFRVVEAILFCTDTPLPAANIAKILGVGTARDVKKHIASLNADYEKWGLSFRIEEIAGGFQMLTIPAYNTWLTRVTKTRQETKLSSAAMETLSIVAYKQPCTRADIEAIRGVAAGDMLNRLREMNLVKIVGRAEDLGRPLLYGTTRRFLEVFGLPSLEDLPMIEGAFRDQSPEPEDKAEESKTEEAVSSAAVVPTTAVSSTEEEAVAVEGDPLTDPVDSAQTAAAEMDATVDEQTPHLSLVSDEDPEPDDATDNSESGESTDGKRTDGIDADTDITDDDALSAEAPTITEPIHKDNEDAP